MRPCRWSSGPRSPTTPSCSRRSAAGWARGSSISGSPDLDRPAAPDLLVETSAELDPDGRAALRALFDAAWRNNGGTFDDHDFAHALGGRHVLASLEGRIVSHGSVVERTLEVDGVALRAGFVEAVATLPELQGWGLGTAVMERLGEILRADFELGALSTSVPAFYERLGWLRWLGPTFVRTADGLERTPDDDGGILVLRTPRTPPLDLRASIACPWRAGDVW